jgi:predicted regulator of Ras-like GTPase activity (Roadblock/LC7/MglB family)
MDFSGILEQLRAEVPGCHSALVMNLDGMVVARQDGAQSPADAEVVLVELLASIKAALQAAHQAGGNFREMTVDLERALVVIRMLGQEHFAALLLGPEALQGKGRFLLRLKGRELTKELG